MAQDEETWNVERWKRGRWCIVATGLSYDAAAQYVRDDDHLGVVSRVATPNFDGQRREPLPPWLKP